MALTVLFSVLQVLVFVMTTALLRATPAALQADGFVFVSAGHVVHVVMSC